MACHDPPLVTSVPSPASQSPAPELALASPTDFVQTRRSVIRACSDGESNRKVFGGEVGTMLQHSTFGSSFRGGAFGAPADVDGDGTSHLIDAEGARRIPVVQVFPSRNNFAFDPSFRAGASVG